MSHLQQMREEDPVRFYFFRDSDRVQPDTRMVDPDVHVFFGVQLLMGAGIPGLIDHAEKIPAAKAVFSAIVSLEISL